MLGFLQKIGRSLMLPVATLPAAAILLRFGNIDYIKDFHMGDTVGGFLNQFVQPFLNAGGSAIMDNLPLIFAVGVAIGFAGDAVAALAAVIAHLVLTKVLIAVPKAFAFIPADMKLDMGVLGGILAGGIAAYFYKKYHDIKLPEWLGFFGGKRFVPIITSLVMVFVGLIFGLIWGPVQTWLDSFGNWVVSLGAIGSGVFMVANRLLIPFGLHHIINTIAWFQIGSFTDAAGNVVHGDIHRFFAGDPSTGMFMTGFFPIMMFALPGAALAIIHTAKKEKRKAVSSIFIGTAFAAFLTGITEPLEFSFMFLAPVLYVIHAILSGLSGVIMSLLDVRLGFGFSAGLIDYILNWPLASKPIMLIPVGLAYFVLYYFLFRFTIVKFNLKTPGREDDDITEDGQDGSETGGSSSLRDKAEKIVPMLGGKENIKSIDACITRLRLVLEDDKKVDEKGLKSLGAAGIMKLGGGSVQVVFGTQSELIKEEMLKL
ncbi:PTS system, N-acetylglucosamine-specific IIBC component [Paenibacillus larvae subsp. larvae]|uniref:PTS system, N-acetylglucosamine-specific IIBC component n=1 Tax=Paenibacillus larvae subsp. larvae TaxID=147375 RepID=A0A2L1TX78_9BACL|nr:N-acetylglucosamine-specific PTS transporter subunit IIBC [Paenibacillus larvae]AQT85856.1 PTS sugar transporter [Paenibacillus larvae subsp. pulvifaciens]AQZ45904.1 PTS sugar transporter [Paenibacillus larvae subsp. pulvifaciens]AVF25287.1 PTS system, N-acetylglucosamine-specific IIBC component [Paenibacillus larvae subsp. larvae]AVF30064.1 PTS system, N-acetylglucosamine-specific IIBC component [Paenibacillus larvae subsp. larvae]MBH0344576.1 PTS sugar transporter [Paenibacillus larvae]